MDTTPNLILPYIAAAQAQKHVTHNEAIQILDVVTQLSVATRNLSDPPATPSDGDRYIVGASATGSWAGQTNSIAVYLDGIWIFHAPAEGWLAWIEDTADLVVWSGTDWTEVEASINPADLVGINTIADGTNKLAVKSDAVLFSHDDVTPGSGDMRLNLNKAVIGNSATMLFQNGFSGRAELGLAGDDDFRFKVSPDGSAWFDAIHVDRASGTVSFPNTSGVGSTTGLPPYVQNYNGENLRFWTRSLRRMLQYNERPRVNLYGDSITLGSGGMHQRVSPGQFLAEELTRRGLAARAHIFGNSFGSATGLATFDPRFSFFGTWTGWTAAQGKTGFRATSAAASVTYAPAYDHDNIDIHYIRTTAPLGGGGEFTITVDGGSTQFSTPTSGGLVTSEAFPVPAGGTDFLSFTVTVDGPPSSHTITLTNGATGVFEFYGFDPWNSQRPEISIRCAGGSGLTSAALATGTALQSIYRLPCDLYLLCIGRNDSSSDVAMATYGANLDAIEANMRVLGSSSILYWTPPPAAASVKPVWQQQTYVDEMIARAGSDIVVFDQFKRWLDRGGQEALAENSGGDWYDDTLHPSQWGNRDIARALANTLLWETA